jgi:hypothetical protein
MYFMFALMGMLAIVALVAVGVCGYALQQLALVAVRATASLAQVKGLTPHAAAPETFAASGRSWESVEKERIEVVSTVREQAKARRAMELRDAIRIGAERGDERVFIWKSELAELENA